jgi:hypothetical protein
MLANHLVDRTPKVQVDEIWLDPLENRFCRVCHTFRVCTKQLDANGTLLRSKVQHFSGVLVAVQYAVSRDKFGHQHIRALFLAKPTKNRVRNPSHRREVKRTCVVKPRKHRRGSILPAFGIRANLVGTYYSERRKRRLQPLPVRHKARKAEEASYDKSAFMGATAVRPVLGGAINNETSCCTKSS